MELFRIEIYLHYEWKYSVLFSHIFKMFHQCFDFQNAISYENRQWILMHQVPFHRSESVWNCIHTLFKGGKMKCQEYNEIWHMWLDIIKQYKQKFKIWFTVPGKNIRQNSSSTHKVLLNVCYVIFYKFFMNTLSRLDRIKFQIILAYICASVGITCKL